MDDAYLADEPLDAMVEAMRDGGDPYDALAELAPPTPPETVTERYTRQGVALRTAAKASPLALYSGMLHAMADELRDVVKALAQAEGDELEGAEVVTAGMLTRGVKLYWPGMGPGRVIRTANGCTGIFVEWSHSEPDWVNVLGPATPVVIVP